MSSRYKEVLIYAIVKFLRSEISNTNDEDKKEAITVATQCLENAYGIEIESRPDLEYGVDLEQLISNLGITLKQEVTPEQKEEAERLKAEGNEMMSQERHKEAIDAYSQAIDLDPNNAIYYSNRAAAYNKLQRFEEALEDCETALKLNPDYGKAYGRLGLALSGLSRYPEAIEAYKKALELEPNNENIKANLQLAEERCKEGGSGFPGSGIPGGLGSMFGAGAAGMPDMSAMFSNPQAMNWVSQMMQNPAVVQMATSFMNNIQQQQGQAGNPSTNPMDMNNLLRMGQQFAAQMQQSSPEVIEQLRSQMPPGGPRPPPGSST